LASPKFTIVETSPPKEDIMAQATTLSPQAVTDAAKRVILAFNEKDWAKTKASITQDFVYDEVATGRKVSGADQTIELWKGWAQALPDLKGSFEGVHVAGETVVLEVIWRGTHKGPLQTPKGSIAATGKTLELRACAVFQVTGEKARSQRHYFDMATLFQQIGAKP
jgi:steroid delta-isomerase-like uncharacterized protein